MGYRRVVVATGGDGLSRVVADGEPPRTVHRVAIPGMSHAHVWSTAPRRSPAYDGSDPTLEPGGGLPGPGGTRMILLTIPPDSVVRAPGFDAEAARAEALRVAPATAGDPDDPEHDMHTTPTVDYDVVVAGPVWLALDEGEHRLETGDVVVQHASRHAWRNHGDAPATVLAVLVGV